MANTQLTTPWKSKLKVAAIASTFTLAIALAPSQARADWGDILSNILTYLQNGLISNIQQLLRAQAQQLIDNANSIFNQQKAWENQAASITENRQAVIDNYTTKTNSAAYQKTLSFMQYTQGKASGYDANTNPVMVIKDFNKNHDNMQRINPNCVLEIPQRIGDNTNQCAPKQLQYQNTMLAGVNPVVTFPESTLNSSTGQQFATEKQSSMVRRGLAETVFTHATNQETLEFLDYANQQIALPTLAQINRESSQAVLRDTLVLSQLHAKIALLQYKATLENQRLLATLVAQQEDNHMERLVKLGGHIK